MNDELPVEFMVAAQIRTAALQGVPILVRRRGYRSGAVMLKINRLDGTAQILTQVRANEDVAWSPASKTPLSDADAEKIIASQLRIDPDSWLIEIEDRQGRHWFPGRILGS